MPIILLNESFVNKNSNTLCIWSAKILPLVKCTGIFMNKVPCVFTLLKFEHNFGVIFVYEQLYLTQKLIN